MKVIHRSRKENSREIRHLIAGETCKQSIGKIYKGMEIFGLNGGQYSIINIIEHILKQTGNADVDISTWSAANVEIKIAENLLINNKIKNLRFLLDRGFPSRQPKYYSMLMKRFGEKSVRLARIHFKFIIIRNKKWNITIRTSMNLNENKRLENFEISDDLNLCKYLTEIINEYFENPLDYKGYDIIKQRDDKSELTKDFHDWSFVYGNR